MFMPDPNGALYSNLRMNKELCGDQSSQKITLLESHRPHERHTDTDIYINSQLEQGPFTQQSHTVWFGRGINPSGKIFSKWNPH